MTQIGLLTGDFDAYLVARNFSALKRWIQPPARNAKPILAGQSDGDVAIGWVDYVTARDRSTIVVDLVGVPPKVQAALAAGGVTARGEFYPSWSDTTAAKNLATDAAGPVLSSIVLHGLDLPACSDIDCVCATLLHERVVTSPGNQAVADLAWKRFRESGDARYARVLRLVADDVPAAVLRADAAPLPASMQERQTAAFAVLGGAPLEMKENAMPNDRPTPLPDPSDEIARLAEAKLAASGWPDTDTTRRRCVESCCASVPTFARPSGTPARSIARCATSLATTGSI